MESLSLPLIGNYNILIIIGISMPVCKITGSFKVLLKYISHKMVTKVIHA
jgi:hypothetical protein